MLVLTRGVNQTICIGNDVTVTILAMRGNKIRVGIQAPQEVAVHRQEVYDAIQKEKNDGGQT